MFTLVGTRVRLSRFRRRRLSSNAPMLSESALLILYFLGTPLAPASAAQQERIPSNAKCAKLHNGMVYIAAGRHVFRQPAKNLGYVHGLLPEAVAGLPVPPRPFEPKGCPDHPMRGSGFKFNPFSDVADPGRDDTVVGGSVQILDIDPSSWWDTHQLDSLSATESCNAAALRTTEIAPGLTACWSSEAQSTDQQRYSRFVVSVDPRHYKGPLGQSLGIHCGRNLLSELDDFICEISYRIADDVGIWYDFHTSLLPLSGLVSFDRELRRRVSEAEVIDYWWPTFPVSGPAYSVGEKRQ